MKKKNYRRTPTKLQRMAKLFWPPELAQKEAELSIIPRLLETQDQFIALLTLAGTDLEKVFQLIETAGTPANLFLKHLVVLADFGGEMLQRVNREFTSLFPSGKLVYLWDGKQREYRFMRLPIKGGLTNAKLKISGKKLIQESALDDLSKDVIALLLFGSFSTSEAAAQVLAKCELSNYLGQPDKLKTFIKQRYIWVSRITGGAQANSLGQITQDFVREHLEQNLKIPSLKVIREGRLPGVTHTDPQTGRLTSFDLVVTNGRKYVVVEVSFQVTTNSTVERKGRQARARFEQIETAGHKIAYVVDGAGNFQRAAMLKDICDHSHCTVAFSPDELNVLCEFITDYFNR
jgi:hypothetical protein